MKKRTRESASLDITPLIDVVFLLLIFFMVSTVFRKDELALLMKLPSSQSGQSSEQQPLKKILIELTSSELALNGAKITIEDLEAHLKALTDNNSPIDLRIDQDVQYSRVINVLDALKKNKLNNISLITAKKENELQKM